MKKHPFDVLSFIFGLTFVVLAGAVAFDGMVDLERGVLRWIGAAVLLTAGALMLFTRSSDEQQR